MSPSPRTALLALTLLGGSILAHDAPAGQPQSTTGYPQGTWRNTKATATSRNYGSQGLNARGPSYRPMTPSKSSGWATNRLSPVATSAGGARPTRPQAASGKPHANTPARPTAAAPSKPGIASTSKPPTLSHSKPGTRPQHVSGWSKPGLRPNPIGSSAHVQPKPTPKPPVSVGSNQRPVAIVSPLRPVHTARPIVRPIQPVPPSRPSVSVAILPGAGLGLPSNPPPGGAGAGGNNPPDDGQVDAPANVVPMAAGPSLPANIAGALPQVPNAADLANDAGVGPVLPNPPGNELGPNVPPIADHPVLDHPLAGNPNNEADNDQVDNDQVDDDQVDDDQADDDQADDDQADDDQADDDQADDDQADDDQADDDQADDDQADDDQADDDQADDDQADDDMDHADEPSPDDPSVAGPGGGIGPVVVPGPGAGVAVIGSWPNGRPIVVRPGFVWGPGLWVPAPAAVAPVVPAQSLAAEPASDAAAASVLPAVPANVRPLMTVVLLNPAANASAVSFLLGADPQTLDAGREFQVRVPTGTFLEFSPGPGLGVSQYLLEAGVYEFQLTKSGWELHRTTFQVTLDNSANATEFNYLANAQPAVLKAGEKRTHEGDFPVVIAFDRGDGQQPARVALPTGTYAVAVNPETQLWDLFVAAAAE